MIFIVDARRITRVAWTDIKNFKNMKDKTYNRITSAILLIVGVGGVLMSLVYAIPTHGMFVGMVTICISIGSLILGLEKHE